MSATSHGLSLESIAKIEGIAKVSLENNSIRILLYSDNEYIYAHALEIDLIATGRDHDECMEAFVEMFSSFIGDTVEASLNNKQLIVNQAPIEYFEEYVRCEKKIIPEHKATPPSQEKSVPYNLELLGV